MSEDNTKDNVVRANMISAMRYQLGRMIHASDVALRKTSLFSKYRRQFREAGLDPITLQFPVDVNDGDDDDDDEDVDPVARLAAADDATMNDAIADELLTDERLEELGLRQLLADSLVRPDPDVKCSLKAVECGRNQVLSTRGMIGLHAVASPSSGTLMILHTDRLKDKLRGSNRNGSVQKIVIQIRSLWSAWVSSPPDGAARLHLALSCAPPCLIKMETGSEMS